ncbi:MAG: GGDEF domain-containing protein [Oscillospiraceae bacterium]
MLLLKFHMNRQEKVSSLLDVKILSAMISLTMFQCVFDALVFWIDGKMFPMAIELNYIGNILYYVLNITNSYLWTLFTEYKLTGGSEKMKKTALVMAIPLILCTILLVTTPINGFVFTVTDDNVYTRTGFNFLITVFLIAFYIMYGTIKVYINRRNKGKYLILPAIYYITPLSIAVTVQSLNYGISLTYIGIAIGLVGVYLGTQSDSAYIDQLCGIYNRRYYNDYIGAFCNSKAKNSTITGVLIDMDNFKSINDNFGHDVGDEALIQFSTVLRKHMSNIGFAVRYGGDEFILITKHSEQDAEKAVADIAKELNEINASGKNKFNLEFSYGIATITPDNSPDDFLNTMDSRMYEMKKERKTER